MAIQPSINVERSSPPPYAVEEGNGTSDTDARVARAASPVMRTASPVRGTPASRPTRRQPSEISTSSSSSTISEKVRGFIARDFQEGCTVRDIAEERGLDEAAVTEVLQEGLSS